jgi:ABC-2 type transport system ATP-binding protein/ribosome-dependent ATPase
MTAPVVVRNVTRRFGSFAAVEQVDLDVEPGEVVGLLGANGAGKTTLIRMILGLLMPTEGQIRLFGRPQSRELRRRVGYVPQNLGLYPDLTVRENLEFRAEVFTADGPASAVAAPDLPAGALDRLVGDLPLGMQRRAAFAAAIQHRPDLVVLDEPTSGVSPLARSKLWDLIRQQAEAGAAVLVSTHYMDEAEQTDRLVVMGRGRIVAAGTATDVVGDRTTVEVVGERWAEVFAALDDPNRHLSLAGRTVRVLSGSVAAVERDLDRAGISARVRTAPATLDETMVELSG